MTFSLTLPEGFDGPVVSRFAPSPTGALHLGHVFAAIVAYDSCRELDGRFLLRLEDIDQMRCRPEYESQMLDDLAWLGLKWEQPIRRQSEHMADYQTARKQLADLGVLYPCFCSRKDIALEISRSGHAPHGPDGRLYPRTCARLSEDERQAKIADNVAFAWRLDQTRARQLVSEDLTWIDLNSGPITARPAELGDVIIARKETPASYHLSVVVDDAIQGINLVTRGADLFHATHIHRLLQALLDLPAPVYYHHRLITDENGKRLAKRNGAQSLRALRQQGLTPGDLRKLVKLDKL